MIKTLGNISFFHNVMLDQYLMWQFICALTWGFVLLLHILYLIIIGCVINNGRYRDIPLQGDHYWDQMDIFFLAGLLIFNLPSLILYPIYFNHSGWKIVISIIASEIVFFLGIRFYPKEIITDESELVHHTLVQHVGYDSANITMTKV
jgi:hypothetical protein